MLALDIKTPADERKLSLREIADRAGVAYNTVLNMYRGVSTRVDLETLDKVAGALGVEPQTLLVKKTERQAA